MYNTLIYIYIYVYIYIYTYVYVYVYIYIYIYIYRAEVWDDAMESLEAAGLSVSASGEVKAPLRLQCC